MQLLDTTIRDIENGFQRVENITRDTTPSGGPVFMFALGGPVIEGEPCALVATSREAAIKQFKRDFDEWLSLTTDGRKSGFVLYWRERPNFLEQCHSVMNEHGESFTCQRVALWWRCAVEFGGKDVNDRADKIREQAPQRVCR